MSITIRFNPTATAIQKTGEPGNTRDILDLLQVLELSKPEEFIAAVPTGHWIAVFMGGAVILTDKGMLSAQGLV